jgi:hypothetical protein
LNGRIEVSTDLDVFQFLGEAGDAVRIVVDATFDGLDPLLELRDPDGMPVFPAASCANSCTFWRDAILSKSGVHTLTISDSSFNEGGNYRLQVEKLPREHRPILPYGDPDGTEIVISPSTDTDHLWFYGRAGTEVQLAIDATFDGLDPWVVVKQPDGATLLEETCANACTLSPRLPLTQTGVYQVLLSDSSYNEGGRIRISLNCLFGACPASSTIVRSGGNPLWYSSLCPPLIGGTWVGEIDAAGAPGATTGVVLVSSRPLSGLPTRFGALLVDLASEQVCLVAPIPTPGGKAHFEASIPDRLDILGSQVFTQGVLVGGGLRLLNAIDFAPGF